MKRRKVYSVKFNGLTLKTTSLKRHYHNVRIISAMKYARRLGFNEAVIKFDYSSVEGLKKAARKKLGDHYPFAQKKNIPDEVVDEAMIMRKTMTVQAIADHFGVSQSHLGKKLSDAKQNTNCDKMFQQLLCGKL